MSLFSMTMILFLIMNSVGHIGVFLSIVEHIPAPKRIRIVVREMVIALILMVFFLFIGDLLLKALDIGPETVSLAGGFILFLIAIRMIFPAAKGPQMPPPITEEPFIVPIATPMIAGPSILTTIMIYAHFQDSSNRVLIAIVIAWLLSITVFLLAPQIRDLVGKRALSAIERLMGLILTLTAVEMFLMGFRYLLSSAP